MSKKQSNLKLISFINVQCFRNNVELEGRKNRFKSKVPDT